MAARHAGGWISGKPTWCNSEEDALRRFFVCGDASFICLYLLRTAHRTGTGSLSDRCLAGFLPSSREPGPGFVRVPNQKWIYLRPRTALIQMTPHVINSSHVWKRHPVVLWDTSKSNTARTVSSCEGVRGDITTNRWRRLWQCKCSACGYWLTTSKSCEALTQESLC